MTRYNFLDITLNLANCCFMPYRKDNFLIKNTNNNSNHQIIIRTHLPKMIEKRLSRLSTNPKTFNNEKHSYQIALRQSNFKHELEYAKKISPIDKKKQKRIYYVLQSPLCQPVKTNILKKSLVKFIKNESMKKFLTKITAKYRTVVQKIFYSLQ